MTVTQTTQYATHEEMEAFHTWVRGFPRKFAVADIEKKPQLRRVAMQYVSEYRGDFEFLVDVQIALHEWGAISHRQAAGVLNSMRAESGRQQRAAVDSAERRTDRGFMTNTDRVIENGTYTILLDDDEDGDYVTIRLRDSFVDEHPESMQMIEYLDGPDNSTDFTGFAFINGMDAKIWKKYLGAERLLNALQILFSNDTDALAARERYALKSGRCARCARKLTVPASINRGVGPECAKHVQW